MGVICRKPRFRAVTGDESYQWFKMYNVDSSNINVHITEVKINDLTPSSAFSSAPRSGYSASKAIDGSLTSFFITDEYVGCWLAVKMGSPVSLEKLSLYPRTGNVIRLWEYGFNLSGSNNSTNGADGTWTLIASGLTRSDDTVRWHEWTF